MPVVGVAFPERELNALVVPFAVRQRGDDEVRARVLGVAEVVEAQKHRVGMIDGPGVECGAIGVVSIKSQVIILEDVPGRPAGVEGLEAHVAAEIDLVANLEIIRVRRLGRFRPQGIRLRRSASGPVVHKTRQLAHTCSSRVRPEIEPAKLVMPPRMGSKYRPQKAEIF